MKKIQKFSVNAIILIMTLLCLNVNHCVKVKGASYYSCKNIGLDYNKGLYGGYGSGKNGYKMVSVISVKGKTVKYKMTKYVYDASLGHPILKPYGKTKSAKITSNTKYYLGDWKKAIKTGVISYGQHSKKFKSAKILKRVSRSNWKQEGMSYIKISNGKITRMVSGIVWAT